MTRADCVRKLCQTREVDTDLQLEVQKLFDHKAKHGGIPVYEASRVIDMLKACPKKGEVAHAAVAKETRRRAAGGATPCAGLCSFSRTWAVQLTPSLSTCE
jgi:hypothetical protein